jgi:predicted nucleotidyltransferase
MNTTVIDLHHVGDALSQRFPAIESLWIFGSRRFGTRSLRSDIDVLVRAGDHIRPGDLRQEIRKLCSALDLFLAENGKAISCMNESFVEAPSFTQLTQKLDALCFWSTDLDEVNPDAPLRHEVIEDIEYPETVMLGNEAHPSRWGKSVEDYFRQIESELLPIRPFLGEDVFEVADLLLSVCERMTSVTQVLESRRTRASWVPKLNSEYDAQDLFYLTVKPWLQDLSREEVTLRFDGQDKRSDFSAFQSRLVVELKYVDDANSKAAVAKTLAGLANFYLQHPNIRVLIMVVFCRRHADVDAAKWSTDFSQIRPSQRVVVRVITVD